MKLDKYRCNIKWQAAAAIIASTLVLKIFNKNTGWAYRLIEIGKNEAGMMLCIPVDNERHLRSDS